MKLVDRIISKIAEITGVDVRAIKPDTVLGREINVDSMQLVEIAVSLEKEFGIEIGPEALVFFDSPGSIAKFVESVR